mgnify:CR=1 FL=1
MQRKLLKILKNNLSQQEVNNTFLKLPELREKESRLNKLNNELSIDGNTGINKDIERKEEIKEKSHRGIHH